MTQPPVERISATADWAALPRAAESVRLAQQRVFGDPWALELLPGSLRALLGVPFAAAAVHAALDVVFPGSFTALTLRNRHVDKFFADSLVKRGVDQVALLGAGLDTTALRQRGLCLAHATTLYELDLPGYQEVKKARVQRAWGSLPEWVRYVPCDLSACDVSRLLTEAGWDRTKRSIIIAEGVFPFLDEDAVRTTLSSLRGLLSSGDRLVFSTVDRQMVAASQGQGGSGLSAGARRVARAARRRAGALSWGLEPSEVAGFLESVDWEPVAVESVFDDVAGAWLYGNLKGRRVARTTWLVTARVPGPEPEVKRGFRRRR